MKKITLLILLLAVSFGFAQQQIYNLTFEPGTDGSNPAYWNVFESDTPAVEVVTNPDPDGVNNDPSTNVLKLNVLTANACYAGAETQHATIGTWYLETGVMSNETISLMINKSSIGRIGVKFVNATNGTIFELTSQTNTLINEWELMTWDISAFIGSAENNNIDQLVLFSDFTCGDPDRTSDTVTYIDNITWGAFKTADPVLPTCSDGIQNGDETGVDCGGSSCSPCETFPFDFETPTPFVGADGASFSIIDDVGNMVGQLEAVNAQNYSNAQIITESLDFSGTPKGFSMRVKGDRAIPILFKVEQNGNPSVSYENSQNYTNVGAWETLIFDFTGETSTGVLNKTVLFFDILGAASGLPSDDIFLFDDIIFGDLGTLGIATFEINEFKVFPNPTQHIWNVRSVQNIEDIQIFDMLGKQVMMLQPNSSEVEINSSLLPGGIYFARIRSVNGTSIMKLVKE
ncbi:MAG: T9SS type A sorting domain-containing protein [Bacteroidia bacterium]|nr:T9SS type A sorting domain-containing protein [Bacteroidia bacterium]NND25623.1 T9SS type A sorting domain-containing protein [Flavobacteriaceae bacterium]NNK59859.1 T9SS type A sorting domain-containing protein [Flavobacteriaceae bacterium]RZW57578.1 MAG: T9SS type A sorting domain-containing protein [Flavobacteriaceae bacterium]